MDRNYRVVLMMKQEIAVPVKRFLCNEDNHRQSDSSPCENP